MLELNELTFRELKEKDRIELDLKNYEQLESITEIATAVLENKEYNLSNLFFMIEEGVVLKKDTLTNEYYYFTKQDNILYISFYFYTKKDYDYFKILDIKIDLNKLRYNHKHEYLEGDIDYNFNEVNSNKSFKVLGYNQYISSLNKKDLIEQTVSFCIFNFLTLFIYLETKIKETKDVRTIIKNVKDDKVSNIKKDNSNTTNTNKQNKRSIVNLNLSEKIQIQYVGDRKQLSGLKKRYTRHVGSWNVRGYVRHYKNGKVVMVKPHVRGKRKDEVQGKIYKI